DNGTGMTSDVKEKMFDPFFTTKPAGEGTGLGLSISHDIIVKQHAGSIEADQQPGEFTEFRIFLPRIASPPKKALNQVFARGKINPLSSFATQATAIRRRACFSRI